VLLGYGLLVLLATCAAIAGACYYRLGKFGGTLSALRLDFTQARSQEHKDAERLANSLLTLSEAVAKTTAASTEMTRVLRGATPAPRDSETGTKRRTLPSGGGF